MAGGPTVNILIAFFIFSAVFATYGQRPASRRPGSPVIDEVSDCVCPRAEDGRACTADGPRRARQGGRAPARRPIVSFNGTEVTELGRSCRTMIRDNDDGAGGHRRRARRRGADRHDQHDGRRPRPDLGHRRQR